MERRGDEIIFSDYEQENAGLPPKIAVDEIMGTINNLLDTASGCDSEVDNRRASPYPSDRQSAGKLIARAVCMRETAKVLEEHLLGGPLS